MTDKTFSGRHVAIEYEGIQEYFSMNYYGQNYTNYKETMKF